jgi:hypothetical protein
METQVLRSHEPLQVQLLQRLAHRQQQKQAKVETMNADEIFNPLKRLEELFKQAAEACGGRLMHFSISPQRELQVLLDLNDDLFLDSEDREMRKAFEEIERNFHIDAKDEKMAEKVRDLSELERKLQDPNEGIL